MALCMTMRLPASIAATAAILLVAGCATDSELYPSLSIRDEERITGVFEPVEPEPYIPTPPNADTLGRIAQLKSNAMDSHGRLLELAERARGPVAAARGAALDSDAWAIASIAIANVEAQRSETLLAVAELDLIYVRTHEVAGEVGDISSALNEVSLILLEEERLIDAFHASLANRP
jgi:hypothetical protein